MDVSKQTVCVIGAGLSGLVTVKCMIDAGFDVTCFEKENCIAGRWNPSSQYPITGSTITNLPHFLSGFSDFPVPDKYPLYLPANLYCTFFEEYAERFCLSSYIRLGCEVSSAVQTTRFNRNVNGQPGWKIVYRTKNDTLEEQQFDYLVVCSGFYSEPFVPESLSNALSNFQGDLLHALEYKSWREFEGKNVVVCGLGNTGGDISVELSHHAKKLYLSTSRGAYVIGRIYKGGKIPVANSLIRLARYVPDFMKTIAVDKIANFVYDLNALRVAPTDKAPTSTIVNDDLCLRIAAGKVAVRTGINRAEGRTIYFTDGTYADDIDAIVLCTGYKRSFHFFDKDTSIVVVNGKYMPLYKGVFSPKLPPNVGFVGMFSVIGSVALTAEMQARYAAEVFRGKIELPENQKMEFFVKMQESRLRSQGDCKEYNFHPNPWVYYDELAEEIGCSRPSLIKLILSDPLLAWNLCFSYSPYEYRLVGPNSWGGARDEILRHPQRMYAFMAGSRTVT